LMDYMILLMEWYALITRSFQILNHKCPVFFTEFSNCYVHYPSFVQQNRLQNIVDVLVKKSVNECHLFCRTYSTNFDGLQDSSDGMICTYYKKFPNIAGPSSFISGNKSYRIDGIRSLCHIGTKFWDWVWDIE
jgi:hypothetical protein